MIYINDIPLGLSNSLADIYADGPTISSHNKRSEEFTSTPFEDLNKIDHWCNLNNRVTLIIGYIMGMEFMFF